MYKDAPPTNLYNTSLSLNFSVTSYNNNACLIIIIVTSTYYSSQEEENARLHLVNIFGTKSIKTPHRIDS